MLEPTPEPMNVTRWGVRAVDVDFLRVYINGLLFDFAPHAAAELAQTIRVILGTEEPTPVVPGISAELLGETIVTLERVGCQFRSCQGPTLAPVPMQTCFVCANLAKLQELLASQTPGDALGHSETAGDEPDDRFEDGELVRCICGGELRPTDEATAVMWGIRKRCPTCAREYP